MFIHAFPIGTNILVSVFMILMMLILMLSHLKMSAIIIAKRIQAVAA
jgi:hypothetical protein